MVLCFRFSVHSKSFFHIALADVLWQGTVFFWTWNIHKKVLLFQYFLKIEFEPVVSSWKN